jgi:hypothetical protein
MQGAAAVWINADSVPMQPLGTQCISLEDPHVDACAD